MTDARQSETFAVPINALLRDDTAALTARDLRVYLALCHAAGLHDQSDLNQNEFTPDLNDIAKIASVDPTECTGSILQLVFKGFMNVARSVGGHDVYSIHLPET